MIKKKGRPKKNNSLYEILESECVEENNFNSPKKSRALMSLKSDLKIDGAN